MTAGSPNKTPPSPEGSRSGPLATPQVETSTSTDTGMTLDVATAAGNAIQEVTGEKSPNNNLATTNTSEEKDTPERNPWDDPPDEYYRNCHRSKATPEQEAENALVPGVEDAVEADTESDTSGQSTVTNASIVPADKTLSGEKTNIPEIQKTKEDLIKEADALRQEAANIASLQGRELKETFGEGNNELRNKALRNKKATGLMAQAAELEAQATELGTRSQDEGAASLSTPQPDSRTTDQESTQGDDTKGTSLRDNAEETVISDTTQKMEAPPIIPEGSPPPPETPPIGRPEDITPPQGSERKLTTTLEEFYSDLNFALAENPAKAAEVLEYHLSRPNCPEFASLERAYKKAVQRANIEDQEILKPDNLVSPLAQERLRALQRQKRRITLTAGQRLENQFGPKETQALFGTRVTEEIPDTKTEDTEHLLFELATKDTINDPRLIERAKQEGFSIIPIMEGDKAGSFRILPQFDQSKYAHQDIIQNYTGKDGRIDQVRLAQDIAQKEIQRALTTGEPLDIPFTPYEYQSITGNSLQSIIEGRGLQMARSDSGDFRVEIPEMQPPEILQERQRLNTEGFKEFNLTPSNEEQPITWIADTSDPTAALVAFLAEPAPRRDIILQAVKQHPDIFGEGTYDVFTKALDRSNHYLRPEIAGLLGTATETMIAGEDERERNLAKLQTEATLISQYLKNGRNPEELLIELLGDNSDIITRNKQATRHRTVTEFVTNLVSELPDEARRKKERRST